MSTSSTNSWCRCDEYEWDLYEITLKLSSSQTLQQSDLFHEEGLGFRRWILDIAAQSSALRLAAVASFGRNNILRLLLESGTADINEVDYVYDPNHTTAAYATTLEVVYQCYLEEFQDSLKSSISDEMFQPSLRTLLEYSGLGADPCIANKTRDQVSPFPNNTLLAYAFEEHATMIEKGEQNLDYDPHNVHDIQIYEDKMQYYVLDSLLDAAREIKNKQNSFARSQYAGSWGNEELIHIVCELATSRAIALRMVQMLVDEYGGNVNHRRRSDKTTPLFIAIGRGHGDVARFLLARGAADAYSDPKSGLQLGYLHVAPGNQRHRRGSAMSNTTDGLSSMTSSFSQFSVGSDTGTVTSIGSDDGRYIEDFVQRDRHHELFFQNDFYVWEQVDKKYGSVREDDFVDSFHWTKKTQSQVKTVRRVIMPGEAPQRLPTSTWIIIKPDWKRYLPDDSPEKLFYMACDTVRFDLAAYMVKALINAFPGREMTNYRAPDGSSALFAACKRLNSGAVKEIIDHQLHHGIPIGVNEIPSTGFKGDENTMKLSLLQQVCGYGSSAGYDLLMHAPMEQAPPDDVIKRLQLHTTRLLVAAGADKQYACAMGGSAQFFAKASRNKKDLLEALGVQ
ncbi:hypothetical protein BJ508DRAFT_81492 [Ascobolus immersus RN42]|uniref:Uncharacterized protein n=1 Tax=Ascobolus immersus RN42 TaxID=1160509 RepID=A0A3N4IA17_ASCIM|nr:hypothetical protein BJ508DRAFT_81492 [Ascobolus immersus RN42]